MLTTKFKFSLGLLFDPDNGEDNDPRLDLVYAVAEPLDGVTFSPAV